MDGGSAQAPLPVFDGRHDLALYPDDACFVFKAGKLTLWGVTFDVHQTRPYTVAAAKAAALAAGGRPIEEMRRWWERHEGWRGTAARKLEHEASAAARDALKALQAAQFNPSRDEAIAAMRNNGMTLQAIGDVFGINKERVRQIADKAERAKQRQRDREAAAAETAALEAAIRADLAALAAAERAKRAKAKRARRVIDLRGIAPATDWRTPADEYAAISAGIS